MSLTLNKCRGDQYRVENLLLIPSSLLSTFECKKYQSSLRTILIGHGRNKYIYRYMKKCKFSVKSSRFLAEPRRIQAYFSQISCYFYAPFYLFAFYSSTFTLLFFIIFVEFATRTYSSMLACCKLEIFTHFFVEATLNLSQLSFKMFSNISQTLQYHTVTISRISSYK